MRSLSLTFQALLPSPPNDLSVTYVTNTVARYPQCFISHYRYKHCCQVPRILYLSLTLQTPLPGTPNALSGTYVKTLLPGPLNDLSVTYITNTVASSHECFILHLHYKLCCQVPRMIYCILRYKLCCQVPPMLYMSLTLQTLLPGPTNALSVTYVTNTVARCPECFICHLRYKHCCHAGTLNALSVT
jgi:hypothetical protein